MLHEAEGGIIVGQRQEVGELDEISICTSASPGSYILNFCAIDVGNHKNSKSSATPSLLVVGSSKQHLV